MAWFTFTDASGEVFVIKLQGRALIEHARQLVAGIATSDPLVGGTVEKTPQPYNIGWSFHLDPTSLFFFEVSTEVGDSTMRYIEDHLAEVGGAFLPGNIWTGWSSVFLDELSPKFGSPRADHISGSAKPDILFGGAGNDQLRGNLDNDHLITGQGNDIAFGGEGADKLSGGMGSDTLAGGKGADVLEGGGGSDHLLGGDGRDTFIFAPSSGLDRVSGFTDLRGIEGDVIDLRAYGFSNKAEIDVEMCGDDLVLVLGPGDAVRLVDYLLNHSANEIANNILI